MSGNIIGKTNKSLKSDKMGVHFAGDRNIGLPEINLGGIEMENENNYPHGVESLPPNPHRIWVCDECDHIFADDEVRIDLASGKWAHECKCHPKRKGQRCDRHLEPFIPELPSH